MHGRAGKCLQLARAVQQRRIDGRRPGGQGKQLQHTEQRPRQRTETPVPRRACERKRRSQVQNYPDYCTVYTVHSYSRAAQLHCWSEQKRASQAGHKSWSGPRTIAKGAQNIEATKSTSPPCPGIDRHQSLALQSISADPSSRTVSVSGPSSLFKTKF